MKVLKIIPLTFVLMLAACGGNATSSTTTSSQPPEPSSQETSSELDLFGFDLKKESDICANNAYNLADQMNIHSGFQLSDFSFTVAQREKPIATVNESGVLTRVAYGTTQVTIARKAYPLFDKSFSISFFPSADAYLGTFTAEMTPVTGHEDSKVTVTLETKQDNKFTISYTTGWLSVGTENPESIQITEAIQAEGQFELEGSLKFTVTSANFPFRSRFGGRLIFDGSNPIIDSRVPVSTEKTSNRTNFSKAAA